MSVASSIGGASPLGSSLSDIPSPGSQHPDDLGRHSSRQGNSKENEALVNSVGESQLSTKTYYYINGALISLF